MSKAPDTICSPAIIGLLRVLPAPNTKWPKAERERWFRAFVACIDLSYPEEPHQIESIAAQASRVE